MDGFTGTLVVDRSASADDSPCVAAALPAMDRSTSSSGIVVVEAVSTSGRQQTLRSPIHCHGIGLHSGRDVLLRLCPAPDDSGIVFRRTDLGIDIPARHDFVVDTRLCTMLGMRLPDGSMASVGTIEHVMAALSAAGIDNALIELDGPEVPILDGSAAPFTFLIACAGRVEQTASKLFIEVLKPVRVALGDDPDAAWAELRPSQGRDRGDRLSMSMQISFASAAIGEQAYSMTLSEASFVSELADCRTFTQSHEIERARAAGLARGGSLDNAVVVDAHSVLNPGGLRRPDEFVRHKLLDAVGDLSLAGRPLRGRFSGSRSGHALNNQLLHALFADPTAWRLTDSLRRGRTRRETDYRAAA